MGYRTARSNEELRITESFGLLSEHMLKTTIAKGLLCVKHNLDFTLHFHLM